LVDRSATAAGSTGADAMTANVERDSFSKPGDTIKSLMRRRGLIPTKLAAELEGGINKLRALLDGSTPIDDATARALSKHLAGTRDFWLKRQELYEAALDRAVRRATDAEAEEWNKIPIPVGRSKGVSSRGNREENLRLRLAFYNVSNLKTWDARYGNAAETHFRTSPTFRSERPAVMAWLRLGELEADLIQTAPWSPERLEALLPAIRALSKVRRPDRFLPKLRTMFADAGVAFVIKPTPRGCHASGAARLVAPDKAMILVSFRYRSDDQFWFTVFHEIGHLLLHQGRAFVDEEETPDSPAERQANKFASDCIVPASRRSEFQNVPTDRDSIMRFAVSIGVSPGLVVGQLQHEGRIEYGRMAALKRRWTWEEIGPAADLD
jgi:HTH-type transcriptional regulator / antitoxin HigA